MTNCDHFHCYWTKRKWSECLKYLNEYLCQSTLSYCPKNILNIFGDNRIKLIGRDIHSDILNIQITFFLFNNNKNGHNLSLNIYRIFGVRISYCVSHVRLSHLGFWQWCLVICFLRVRLHLEKPNSLISAKLVVIQFSVIVIP